MKKILALSIALLVIAPPLFSSAAKGDDFGAVVKLIEQFYHVKHQSIPLLARAGVKAATTAARVKGGEYRRLVEAGSVRAVFFEDQEFNSRGDIGTFKGTISHAMEQSWSPILQTLSSREEEQTHIFIRSAGEKFNVLVVTSSDMKLPWSRSISNPIHSRCCCVTPTRWEKQSPRKQLKMTTSN